MQWRWLFVGCLLSYGVGCGNDGMRAEETDDAASSLLITQLVKINFQPARSVVPSGFLADSGSVFGNRGNGFTYGWGADNSAQTRQRNSSLSPSAAYDTLTHLQKPAYPDAVWELAVASGSYRVRIVAGDAAFTDSVFKIDAEGVRVVDGTPTAANHWVEGTATVAVSDGRLTVRTGAGAANNKIDFIEIASVASTGPTGSTGSTGTGAGTGQTGNPRGRCASSLPEGSQLLDTSRPTTVIGTGTPASCTFSALNGAVTAGGIITFDCGPSAASIAITATMTLRTDRDTVIDGGHKITLDGGGATQIFSFNHGDWAVNDTRVTLQRIAIVNGKKTPRVAIPPAPAPCSQGWNDGQGGAIFMRDGNLTVIDSLFKNNQAAPLGPDTGGGAIYMLGSKRGLLIVNSTFTGNRASNGGAVGVLFSDLNVYNSLFTDNIATGNGANNNDPSKCSVINNGQNEIGSGGNGGALYNDGATDSHGDTKNVVLCGSEITGNKAGAGAFGGGLFFTSNDFSGTLSIADTTMTGNTGGSWTNAASGTIKNAGTAVGTNCKSISISNSTIQGR